MEQIVKCILRARRDGNITKEEALELRSDTYGRTQGGKILCHVTDLLDACKKKDVYRAKVRMKQGAAPPYTWDIRLDKNSMWLKSDIVEFLFKLGIPRPLSSEDLKKQLRGRLRDTYGSLKEYKI